MFHLTALLVALVSVQAFQPVSRVATKSNLKMGYEKEIGAQAPLGYWDPLGLLKNAPQNEFDQLRSAEIKHGRIAMLAIVGHMVTTSGVRVPGDIAFGVPYSSMKAGLAALDTIPAWGIAQTIAFIGLLEYGYGFQKKNIEDACGQIMKDYGWSDAKQKSKAAIELNNGRAAQMGILGLMVHEKLNNDPYVLNALLGSPVPFN